MYAFCYTASLTHDDVIKWKHFPRNWPFVRKIHRSPVNSPHKGQWRGALMFPMICVWINGWVNNRKAGDLRRYRTHYDVIVMEWEIMTRINAEYIWYMILISKIVFYFAVITVFPIGLGSPPWSHTMWYRSRGHKIRLWDSRCVNTTILVGTVVSMSYWKVTNWYIYMDISLYTINVKNKNLLFQFLCILLLE